MDRGIISCFRRKVGFDLFFTAQNPLFEESADFRFHFLFAKIHHAHSGKGFYFFEIPIWEGFHFLEIPILRIWVHLSVYHTLSETAK